MSHNAEDLISIFNQLFAESEQTILVGGADEPLYLPKDSDNLVNQILFTKDYFASALHEVAHWCIAGKARRKLIDYGYWYYPDGRTRQQQIAFEKAEVKPQALEYIFAMAAGSKFNISLDNLKNGQINISRFNDAVNEQVSTFLKTGLPIRAEQFKNAVLKFYQGKELRT